MERGIVFRQDVSVLLREYLYEARQALSSYYGANPSMKKIMAGYGGVFSPGDDGVSFIVKHSIPFRETEEKTLSFHLWRLRRTLLRVMVRSEYFYMALEEIKRDIDKGRRDIYAIFEWDNIAKSRDFLEKKEAFLREAERVYRETDPLKGLALLARAVRSLSLRWGIVREVAQKHGGELERETAKTIREIEHLFVMANTKLIPYCLGLLRGRENEIDYGDLASEGIFALYRAIDKYDHGKGCKFATYATWWIKQHITKAIYEMERRLRLSVGAQEKLARLNKVERELEMKLERLPSDKELARELGMSLEEVVRLRWLSHDALSLDYQGDSNDGELGPLVERVSEDREFYDPEKRAIQSVLRDKIMEIINERLTHIEKEVILARMGFYAGESEALASVAKRFDKTRSWAKRVEERALQKLRVGKHSAVLRSFIEDMG